MAAPGKPMSISERRGSHLSDDFMLHTARKPSSDGRFDPVETSSQHHIRGPPTPSMSTPAVDFNHDHQLGASPPPPPTPAASPGPSTLQLDWRNAGETEDFFLAQMRKHFSQCSQNARKRVLADLLNMCSSGELSFVHHFVSPMLKKDPFTIFPNELCLRVLSFIDDPRVLARASQVSRRWRDILSDDLTWKNLCAKHDYDRRLSNAMAEPSLEVVEDPEPEKTTDTEMTNSSSYPGAFPSSAASSSRSLISRASARPRLRSYRSHFRQRYLVEAAWRSGGTSIQRKITQEGGVVTTLELTPNYIIMALDNAKIHVFDPSGGNQRVLTGHVMGVWAMVTWGNTLVSGGCDRDVRVWDLETGQCLHTLRGHTSTVRCLGMVDENTAISGSRDTTLRVWDIRTGLCKTVLLGHQSSVRCLEIKGDLVVSGSYDTFAKVWSISEGRCLQTLQGHYSQIYAIAFDGNRVVTGSLDTNVRIWDAHTGECLGVLQGHTSLVGQLQLRGDTLVTGGSDGCVRIWSLQEKDAIHRLAAHDNSVTSLQFDDTRVVSGGSDGRVKIWDLKTGRLVRELMTRNEAIWRVAFEDEKCVILALRNGRTVMELWTFSPPDETAPGRPLSSQTLELPAQPGAEPNSVKDMSMAPGEDTNDTDLDVQMQDDALAQQMQLPIPQVSP